MRLSLPILVGTAIAAACSTPTEVCGCSPPPPFAAVATGIVLDDVGSPIAGAVVSATAIQGACPGLGIARQAAFATPPTDSTGRYHQSVFWNGPDSDIVCARFTARRSDTATGDSLVSPPMNVPLSRARTDTVRVDFTFPPPAGASGRHAP